MGTTCTLIRLSDHSLGELLEEPARLQPFLTGQTTPLTERSGLLQRLLRKKPREIHPVTEARTEGDLCELDKAWAAIHFLLTATIPEKATSDVLGFLVSGGTDVGDIFLDGVHGFLSGEVVGISEALSKVGADQLRMRYAPQEMDRLSVYPGAWNQDAAGLDYILKYFTALREFMSQTARRQQALLIHLNS